MTANVSTASTTFAMESFIPEPRRSRTGWLVFRLSALELWRNPLGLVLLVVIPAVFIGMIWWTASQDSIPLKIYFGEETFLVSLTQRQIGLVFVSAAVSGFLASYYALILFHNDFGYFRFCAFMGLSPPLFTAARFAAFIGITAMLAAATAWGLGRMTSIEQPFTVFAGFLLITVIYGAYGGIVGVLSRSFMPALLLIVLLADLDAGWLQNPVYYSAAQESQVIRWLPAFHPCQMVFSAAFTPRDNPTALVGSLAWAAATVSVLILVVQLRMRGPLAAGGRFDQ
jgi:hypothetical protein